MNEARMNKACNVLAKSKLAGVINEMENRIAELEEGGGEPESFFCFTYTGRYGGNTFTNYLYTFKRNPVIGDVYICTRVIDGVFPSLPAAIEIGRIGFFIRQADIDGLTFVEEEYIDDENCVPYTLVSKAYK